jgi:branched-chain amino acid transport system permease protein
VRATAQDRDAAQQMGVDVNRVNQSVFAIASALGGLSGVLVGMYYNNISPAMSFQATLKGVVATVVGGVGNVPGAIVGSMLLALTESYGVALFGTPYRNLFAFVPAAADPGVEAQRPVRPQARAAARATHRHLHRAEQALGRAAAGCWPHLSWLRWRCRFRSVALPAAGADQRLALCTRWPQPDAGGRHERDRSRWAMRACWPLVRMRRRCWCSTSTGRWAPASSPRGCSPPSIGTALIFPAFRLRGHYVSIATLGIGEIVALTILNWESLTRGPIGVSGIPPLSLFGRDASSNNAFYWASLGALVLLALLQWRLLRSHLGRTFRAVREDDVAARAYGVSPDRYKAMAFGFGGFAAGVSGAFTAHLYSYINHETFTSQISILR